MTLPSTVRLTDVGPRDGFQMETRFLPTDLKIATVEALAAAGLPEIEATSFVHPRVIPQMADAAEVLGAVLAPERAALRAGTRFIALVPNLKGAVRALDAGAEGLRQVIIVTESYNRRNVGMAVDESIAVFEQVVELAASRGVEAHAVLGAAFGCPMEGDVPIDRVVDVARRCAELGRHGAGRFALGLGDSAGLGHPLQTRGLIGAVRDALPDTHLWLHLHDTRGTGIANAFAALEMGIDHFDTSLGGLGGCPVVRGASGNIATEDMIYVCHEMGIDTGVDLERVRAASRRLEEFLGRPLPSRVLQAGTREQLVALQDA